MSDRAAPLSRKQRLMAAAGAALSCFICGGGIARGKELKLPVRPAGPAQPFFPFLQQQEPAPGARGLSAADGCVLVCAVCRCFLAEQWAAFERARTPVDKRVATREDARDSELSELSDADALPELDPEPEPEPEDAHDATKPGARRRRAGPGTHWAPEPRASVLRGVQEPWPVPTAPDSTDSAASSRTVGPPERSSTPEGSDVAGSLGDEGLERPPRTPADSQARCCYVCGSALSPASQQQIHVQKQEAPSQAPFFPFLWLHSPPPGAQPITEAGSTLVCPCCFSSLTHQWQSFELANVPVLQRLYVVPLNSHAPGMASKARRLPREEGPALASGLLREACYLCGEDCTRDARAVPSRIVNGNSGGSMHFPFLSLLPCPPNARPPNKRCEVRSCPKCFSVLEDVWALYRASHNRELISSVQGFLGRYHQAFSASDPTLSELPASAQGGPPAVCYICGAELGPGKEFQLSMNPASHLGEKEPFFPFLTVYPPAPRARPADSTGLVTTCVLCYHDLLGQWLQHEARAAHQAVSAWSRQYQVDTFVCFFCQQEKKRCLGLKSVRVARLPLFLYTLRASHSLLVDDGRQLIIGACVECGTLVCAGQGLSSQGPMGWSSPAAGVTKPVAKSHLAKPLSLIVTVLLI
ncbi:hypothetical protein A6R68_10153 [Neotoma lepida]|uniref:Genetic suppressor element 1 n=1 Tax=Neotoma lepida TaxID=56216 RepID=A0A1A6FYP6_NEOLE|nr:hypothetical protein A6R68_10153 [Neotoma lepida]